MVLKMSPEFSEETIMVDTGISKAKCTWPKMSTWTTQFILCCLGYRILRTNRLCLIIQFVFLRENINQDTVGLEFRNLSDLMDHDADRDSDKNAGAYGGPEREWLSRAIYEILWTIKSLEDLPLWTTVCEI